MSNTEQKVPFAQSLNNYATRKISDAIKATGQALPCTVTAVQGSIITVSFDVNSGNLTLPTVTIPHFGGEYIRYPTQVGDKGFVIPASVSLRKVSGLGTGTPDLTDPGNLTALVFMPIANKNWSQVDGSQVTIYGPGGVKIMTSGGNPYVNVTGDIIQVVNSEASVSVATSQIVLTVGGSSITIADSGVVITGKLTINGQLFTDHEHKNVKTGSSNTGGVVV